MTDGIHMAAEGMELPRVVHLDLDAFFASVEQVLEPGLRGRPVIVGSEDERKGVEQVLEPGLRGRPVIVGSEDERKGVVASASYEARRFGIRAGMPVIEARRLCPQGVYLAGHCHEYERFSKEVFEVLRRVSPAVEEGSLDEGYISLRGCERLYACWSARPLARMAFRRSMEGVYVRREDRAIPPAERTMAPERFRWVVAVALWLKRVVHAQTGLSASLGIAANKLAAKAASDFAKPNGLVVVEPGRELDFFGMLGLGDIPGIGRATRAKLREWNVTTVSQARRLPLRLLQCGFGQERGEALYGLLRGRGFPAICRERCPQSISRATTFYQSLCDLGQVESILLRLTERLGNAVRRGGLEGLRVQLKMRYEDFCTITSSAAAPAYTDRDAEIFRIARSLLRTKWRRRRRLRLVGVELSRLRRKPDVQSKLFADDAERHARIDRCLDNLRLRFGFDVVRRGLTLSPLRQPG